MLLALRCGQLAVVCAFLIPLIGALPVLNDLSEWSDRLNSTRQALQRLFSSTAVQNETLSLISSNAPRRTALEKIISAFLFGQANDNGESSRELPESMRIAHSDTQLDLAHRMGRYAAAAYCSSAALASWSCGMRCVDSHSTKSMPSPVVLNLHWTDGTNGYLATNHQRRELILAYRGTLSLENVAADLLFIKTDFPFPNAPADAMIHRGFWTAYAESAELVQRHLADLMNRFPAYRVLVTGHSMGGAMALLAGLDLFARTNHSRTTADRMHVVTFGEPRVGNRAFADFIALGNLSISRVVNDNDLVAQLPPRWLDFVHHGQQELWIRAHHQKQADISKMSLNRTDQSSSKLMANRKTFRCSSIDYEHEQCSSSRRFLSLLSHLNYWDIRFGPWC